MNAKELTPLPVFKEYPAERLIIDSLRSRLNDEEQQLRMEIINRIIDGGEPLLVNELLSGSPESTASIFKRLQEKKVIVLDDGADFINFVYPVSALPSPHQVTLEDGRSFYAMCAIDSMGAVFTLNQNVSVKSQCSACGMPITLSIRDGQLENVQPDSMYIIHADLSNSDNWAASC